MRVKTVNFSPTLNLVNKYNKLKYTLSNSEIQLQINSFYICFQTTSINLKQNKCCVQKHKQMFF